jgi:hypothetical protein
MCIETPATDIINEYMTQSPTLRPLLLAVKAIFRDAGLNDRSGSTYRVRSFSSFAITLVTITTLLVRLISPYGLVHSF